MTWKQAGVGVVVGLSILTTRQILFGRQKAEHEVIQQARQEMQAFAGEHRQRLAARKRR